MGLLTPCRNTECSMIYLNVSKFTGPLPGLLDVKENICMRLLQLTAYYVYSDPTYTIQSHEFLIYRHIVYTVWM
jgi:hypothetical protein